MSIETQLRGLLGETGTREIRLTQSEYDQVQHELCMTIAQMIWGERGLVESLGPAWYMVMDPRFGACEKAWYKKIKVTASEHGYQEQGLMIVDDTGNIFSSRLISLDQYSEMLGEGRHFLSVVDKFPIPVRVGWEGLQPARGVKDWDDNSLIAIIKQECPNYFNQKGEPNDLAKVLLEMFKADWLGLILDYAEVSNIDQWIIVESGDVAHDTSITAAEKTPIAHAEIEYLDRALMYRAVIRANTIKVLTQLAGPTKLAKDIKGLVLTEFEKDVILQEVFKYPYDQLYKALPVVIYTIETAKRKPFEERENAQIGAFKKSAKTRIEALKSGELKPLDLLDGDTTAADSEGVRFEKIRHNENLVALFYMLVQAEGMAKEYPMFQDIIDLLLPIIEACEPVEGEAFTALCEKVQEMADIAICDPSVCVEGQEIIHDQPE